MNCWDRHSNTEAQTALVMPVKTGIQTVQTGFPIKLGMTALTKSELIDSLLRGDDRMFFGLYMQMIDTDALSFRPIPGEVDLMSSWRANYRLIRLVSALRRTALIRMNPAASFWS